jgi:hypothetical protein
MSEGLGGRISFLWRCEGLGPCGEGLSSTVWRMSRSSGGGERRFGIVLTGVSMTRETDRVFDLSLQSPGDLSEVGCWLVISRGLLKW